MVYLHSFKVWFISRLVCKGSLGDGDKSGFEAVKLAPATLLILGNLLRILNTVAVFPHLDHLSSSLMQSFTLELILVAQGKDSLYRSSK